MNARLGRWGLLALVSAVACAKNQDAHIVLRVDADATVTKSAITELQVTVAGVTRTYPVTKALPVTLGIVTTKTGDLAITVVGVAAQKAAGTWLGTVTAKADAVVTRDVLLSCAGGDCGTVVGMGTPDGGLDGPGAGGASGSAGGTGGAGGGAAGGGGQAGGTAGVGGHAGGAAGTGAAGAAAGRDGGAGATQDAGPDAVDAGSDAACGGANLKTSMANCGACGYACLHGRSCVAGRCTPAWLPTSDVGAPTARFRHGASSINGRVLISGGAKVNNTGAMSDTFFYDPGDDTWTAGPAMSQARCAHTSVSSGSTVLVFGGLTDCADGATTGPGLEQYDPTTNGWSIVTAAGALPPRYDAQALWTPSHEMFVYAGTSATQLTSGGLFNPATKTWRDGSCGLASCSTTEGAFFSLDANTVVVWGGFSQTMGMKFDLAQGAWSAWAIPAGSPFIPAQFAEDATRWFVLNGNDNFPCPASVAVHIFDKARGTWTNDSQASPTGLAIDQSNPNNTVWTGAELFLWSASCDVKGVGGLYQPPAP
jgi:Galactose oxidase, central domain